jgi:hypothetical protein
LAGFKRRLQQQQESRIAAASLGDLAREGVGVYCWCNRCSHSASLAIDPLLGALGPAFPVPELGARLRCSGCGSKNVATRPDWPGLGQVARHS